ncbi:MAG: hypothetical protein WDN44_14210 [Sphingomonas sp.]
MGGPTDTTARITRLTYPAGETLIYSYKLMSAPTTYYALRTVSSNLGYQLRFTYAAVSGGFPRVASVVAFNMADETCDPDADTCTLAGNWPSITLDSTSHATDNVGQTASLSAVPAGSGWTTTVTYPSGRQESFTRDSSDKVLAYSDGVGTWTYATGVDGVGVGHALASSPGGDSHTIVFDGRTGRVWNDLHSGPSIGSIDWAYDYNATTGPPHPRAPRPSRHRGDRLQL